MKRLLSTLFVLALSGLSLNAYAAPAVCKNGVINVQGNGAFIYKNSAPLRACPQHGCRIIGFRTEPTLIGARAGLSRSGTTIYSAKGKNLGRCPWAPADGFSGGRYRCTMNTSSIRRSAQNTSGNPAGYFTLPGGKCALVPHLGKCYGSVKGLCNRAM